MPTTTIHHHTERVPATTAQIARLQDIAINSEVMKALQDAGITMKVFPTAMMNPYINWVLVHQEDIEAVQKQLGMDLPGTGSQAPVETPPTPAESE